eukprot:scaffold163931_cov32-Tisochrysis_lutea.AAC.3
MSETCRRSGPRTAGRRRGTWRSSQDHEGGEALTSDCKDRGERSRVVPADMGARLRHVGGQP